MKKTESRIRGRGLVLTAALAVLLMLPVTSLAQAGAGTVGVRLDGGASWSLGGSFADNAGLNATRPMAGGGVYWLPADRLRLGAGYSYTSMMRRQLDGKMVPLPGGGQAADLYRDLKAGLHGLELTCEYRLLGEGPLAFYAGAGAGCLFAAGNIYTLGVKNEITAGGMGNSISFTGGPEKLRYAAPFIPVTLSLEYEFIPQVSVSLSCGYRLLLTSAETAAKGQPYAALGLRLNLR